MPPTIHNSSLYKPTFTHFSLCIKNIHLYSPLPTVELLFCRYILAILAEEQKKISMVQQLYVALSCGDSGRVQGNLASEVDWWFHGPPCCQYLMRSLTGITHDHCSSFQFLPRSITVLGNKVVVEGWEGESCYWIHVWTVDNGIITEVREYFNTSLVVKEFKPTSSSAPLLGKRSQLCVPLWQSKLNNSKSKSMPGLVLAI
ncbi:hypothetical protein SUGI_0782160 [Cryptomeria japonica]|uniref:wound-induced protein 1 n=1 Tax=Cryptomeria japonica TaxID=3369 RepID=UPI002414CE5F|nr:wound-induced protein 1 [Cryptomeria japonica]GLJ38413.1 hypothetical protein SUGI_0782160 [Cryptomeria japonica]